LALDPERVDKWSKDSAMANADVDGPYDVKPSGWVCYDNKCETPSGGGGCAKCKTLRANLPLTAQVVKVRCFSTANHGSQNNGGDVPIQEIPCGQDWAWSFFEWPKQTTTATNTVVETTYYNRSHDRTRTVRLEVQYTE